MGFLWDRTGAVLFGTSKPESSFASPISPSDLETRAWWRGSRPTRSLHSGDGSVSGVVENHPRRSSWEVRMVFSPLLVPDLVQTSGVAALEQIVAETSGWETGTPGAPSAREGGTPGTSSDGRPAFFHGWLRWDFWGWESGSFFYVQYGRAPEVSFSPVPGEIPR